ncbi:3-hydroxyisobutyryl-CoA hydrolase 1-like isoform X1 [Rhododendron vialii]|uniref:3-hydroxyisobutyryl-CoA hydrolase 1-like isoform X1 n=2 Tax=Rhododendron vialii TaxID=182163 RepID=UPI00265F71E9|nr:3-hydroxyisobutyryl-CoA hydrolase 1-like isoform X1 [Rhododendron vialii]
MEPINSTNGGADQVLVEGHSHAKKVVFNRPKQLNALSFQMVSRLLELFLACEGDHNVKLIILKGKGRAFCAGGDVAAVVHDITEGNWKLGAEFFRIEYIMNYVMATYSKPQVSILNGIVMGGGAGASIHGRFRVATENSVFAMPETALGLFPDVGATYFLPRLPGFFGEYVGLTGTRLDGAEMLACGLATHFVPEVRLSLLEEALCNSNSSDPAIISAIIDEFSQQPRLKEKSVYHLLDIINNFFSRRTVEEIILALEREAVNTNNGWISSTIKSLKAASPTSLKITLRSIREGRHQGVGQCLISEYRMVCHVMQGKVSKDFMEGCRAILLDKDKNPKWEPSKLELVSDEMVNRYFSKVDEEHVADLKLPTRSNLPAHAIAKL